MVYQRVISGCMKAMKAYMGNRLYRVFSRSSLRARLISVILLTTLPLMVLISYGAKRQFARETFALEQEVQRLTAFIAGDVDHLLEATRQILVAVSVIDSVTSPEVAKDILDDLASQCPFYASFGVVNSSAVTCRSERVVGAASAPIDRQLLQSALESRRLVAGNFHAHASDGKDLLGVAYCVRTERTANSPTVSFAVLDLGWLDALLSEERVTGSMSLFPHEMILNILDRSGTLLTRYPDKAKWTGKKLPDSSVLRAILQKGEGTAELTGVDGITRFYAFQSVKASPGDIFVCTGVSKAAALAAARKDMQRILVGVSTVCLLLVLAAWFGTSLFITQPVASLVAATQRLSAGDLGVRTNHSRGPLEIAHLASAFDRMAETLQQDAHDRAKMRSKLVEYDRQLRSMSVEAALAEEQERKQIAMGLHDKAGPLLAACYMKLGRALKVPAPQQVTAAMIASRDLIDQALGELRSLTFDLSSPTLYTLGLPATVEELCKDTARHHGLEIVFRNQGMPEVLSDDQRVVLYRASRELLLNVVKHAEATRVTVICGGDAEKVFISVADDGVGFDAVEAGSGFSRTGGFGLFSLRERLEHLGGRFTVKSSRSTGTCVVVALPVRTGDEKEETGHGNQDTPG